MFIEKKKENYSKLIFLQISEIKSATMELEQMKLDEFSVPGAGEDT